LNNIVEDGFIPVILEDSIEKIKCMLSPISTESEILYIQDNPKVRIPTEIMDEINQRLNKKELPDRIKPYEICQKRTGAFPIKLKKLIIERKRYQ
jgi:hypothetical protein